MFADVNKLPLCAGNKQLGWILGKILLQKIGQELEQLREVVGSPSLEEFKKGLSVVLKDMA